MPRDHTIKAITPHAFIKAFTPQGITPSRRSRHQGDHTIKAITPFKAIKPLSRTVLLNNS